jgi:hypothetical protein
LVRHYVSNDIKVDRLNDARGQQTHLGDHCPNNPTLDAAKFGRQVGIFRIKQKSIKPTLVLDRPERMSRKPNSHLFLKGVAQYRRSLQVRQEPPAGLVVSVANVISA